MKNSKTPLRIKSAAFLRSKRILYEQQPQKNPESQRFISEIPVSQSRLTIGRPFELAMETRKKTSCSRLMSARTSPSITSSVWRKVHSTHSQYKLKSLQGRKIEEEPVRINLLEKVDRIKLKSKEQQQKYQKCVNSISKKTIQRARLIQNKGQLGNLQKKIQQLLIPFERNRFLEQERYRSRLLKVHKR